VSDGSLPKPSAASDAIHHLQRTAIPLSSMKPMEMETKDNISDKPTTAQSRHSHAHAHSWKPIWCPFDVRIDGATHDHFYELRDATASDQVAKRKNPMATVVVTDVTKGKLMI
jgi:hypothetical protein